MLTVQGFCFMSQLKNGSSAHYRPTLRAVVSFEERHPVNATVSRKILIAVDGSDQALEAVRYAAALVPPAGTEIVLFYVGTGFPEVFWDMKSNPLYQNQKRGVMGWLADNQLVIGEFKEKALNILKCAGFSEPAVTTKTQAQKTCVLKDILQESYQDYSAIVVGRTGMSRFKDIVIGSMAYKLAKQVKHIPTIIVAGRPASSRILVAMDDSMEAMRGVVGIGALSRSENAPDITLCHCLHPPVMSPVDHRRPTTPEDESEWLDYNRNRFQPVMDNASERLIACGFKKENIHTRFVFCKANAIQKITDVAITEDFGTVVVGRREAVGFVEAHFRGRFSHALIRGLDNRAVWVVS
jgi:hypothetical protein